MFVGVNTQDEESRAREFIEKFGITYPNGMDRAYHLATESESLTRLKANLRRLLAAPT